MRMLSVLMACVCAASAAAESLESWVETALEKNPELAAYRHKWEAAKQRVPQAKAIEDPMIGVDFERSGSTRFNQYADAEIMLSQKLPWFGKRGARVSVARLEAEAEGFRYLEALRDTRAKVTGAFWDLWLAQRSKEIAAETADLMEKYEKVTRVQYETGKGTQADVVRAQLAAARMRNEAVTMEREAVVAVHALNQLLNAEPDTPRRVDKPAALPAMTMTLEQMQEAARQYCCILLSHIRTAQARESSVKVAKLESAPDVEFRVEARQFNGKSGIQEYDTGVFLNFPWLWRGKYKAMVGEATAQWNSARSELDAEINMTMLDVKELHTMAEADWRMMELCERTLLPQSKQLVEATRIAYENGQGTFLEFVESAKTYRDAQLDYERSRSGYGKAFAKLDAIVGPWGEREYATGLVPRETK